MDVKMELRKTEAELLEENVRLKKKINSLIDLIDQFSGKSESGDTQGRDEAERRVPDVLDVLSRTCREVEAKKLAISGRRTSKNKDFLKIRENDFDKLFEDAQRLEIYDFLAAMGILKTQVSGKVSWSDSVDGESVRIILFRKSAYRYFLNAF